MIKHKNGVLVVSHGPLATSIISSAEMIIGKISGERLGVLMLEVGANIDSFYKKMKELTEYLLDKNENVVIFTDLLGGTPNNTALKIAMENDKISVITGYNLMLLIEVFSKIDSELDIDELVNIGKGALLNVKSIVLEEEEDEEWL
ncbi:PTS sugar transporter subunit IIA [Clostridium baratii]|uniref:PTS sugar transporter subunit IIA n=1 Tax=Clostridium baratii TaxID=1561 RepID=UPI00097FBAC2|nr:PTS sugar transporter subunit IIA [Clostridium baratii]